jgi:C-terminal processing protease CtpA/Prc
VKEIRAQRNSDYVTKEMVEEERKGNFGFREVRILAGNVGYLDLRIFFQPKYAGATAVAAMNFLSNCEAIIVDLRSNGGGWGEMVALLISYFLDNNEIVHLTTNYSRPKDKYDQSWTLPYVPGKVMPDVPLFVLTSKSTFSAAEEFCYCLKHLERATLVGETTRGGAHPIDEKIVDDNFILILPEQRSINPKTGGNWEGAGVEPHVVVPAQEAFDSAHMRALEVLFSRSRDENDISRYKWYLEGLKAKLNPSSIDSEALRSYVGSYESNDISLENGVLYFRRGGRAKQRMTPITEEYFLIENEDDRRLRFAREDDQVRSLEICSISSAVAKYCKTSSPSVFP